MSDVRAAVIGVGALGRHHARILSGMDGVEMIAVCDPNESQGQAVANQHGLRYVADYREILPDIDAASIVVPTALHRAVAEDCFDHNVHVMVEKPLAGNITDGAAILEAAYAANRTLSVGHIERFNPTFNDLEGACSTPHYIRAERFSPYAFRSTDISAVHDLMIHDIELVQRLTKSTVCRVEAFGTTLVGGYPDVIQARLTFESGCVADLTANRVCPDFKRAIHVWSDSGCHTADLHNRTLRSIIPGKRTLSGDVPLDCFHSGESVDDLKASMFKDFFEVREIQGDDRDALTAELTAFIESVQFGSRPVVTGENGLAALDVADQVLAAVHAYQSTASLGVLPAMQATAERAAA